MIVPVRFPAKMRQNRLRCEQSEPVDVKLAPSLLRRHCLERPIGAVASVIHECIDTPESGEAGIDGRPNRLSIPNVEARDQRPLAFEGDVELRRSLEVIVAYNEV